jgi:hypothetical protein
MWEGKNSLNDILERVCFSILIFLVFIKTTQGWIKREKGGPNVSQMTRIIKPRFNICSVLLKS